MMGGVPNRFAVVPAAYLYLLDRDRVLLQLRQNTGYMDGFWAAGAAGHVEMHETAAACAIREAKEELGIVLSAGDLEPVTVMQRTDGTADPEQQRVDWFFVARRWAGEPRVGEPRKCAALRWHELTRLPEPMPPHERTVLHELATGTPAPFSHHGFPAAT